MHPTKVKLITAARQTLLDGGWTALTAQDVRRAAGVSHGSLWHHFPAGPEEVAAAVFEQLHDEIWRDVLAGLDVTGKAPAPGIERSIGKLFARYEAAAGEVRLLAMLEAVLLGTDQADVVVSRRRGIETRIAAWSAGRVLPPMPAAVLLAVMFGPAWSIIMTMPPGEESRAAAAMCIAAAVAAVAPPSTPSGRRSLAPAKAPAAQSDDLFAQMAGGAPASVPPAKRR